MNGVFYYAKSFNQELNNWNVSNVKNMSHMFNNTLIITYPEWYS